jgi:hypothetical protein
MTSIVSREIETCIIKSSRRRGTLGRVCRDSMISNRIVATVRMEINRTGKKLELDMLKKQSRNWKREKQR